MYRIDRKTFKNKEQEKKFLLSYIKWSKKDKEYIPLKREEESDLEVILLNTSLKREEIVEVTKQELKNWKKQLSDEEYLDLINDCLFKLNAGISKNCYIFVYGKNLINNNKNPEIFSIGVFNFLDKSTGYLDIVVSYPKSQVDKEKRTDEIIGGAGSNIIKSIISYAFNTLSCICIDSFVTSDKALLCLKNLGFKKK